MKKKFLKLALYVAMAVSLFAVLSIAAFATDTTVTVGEGTTENTAAPWTNFFYNSESVTIYSKDDIGGSGTIKSIAYNFAATGTDLKINYMRIYLGTTTDTSLSTTSVTMPNDLTLVYENTDTSTTLGNNTSGWKTFTFNKANFSYDGTKNLVVVVVSDFANEYSGIPKVYSTRVGGTVVYNRSDTHKTYEFESAGNAFPVYGRIDDRPNIQLTFAGPETTTQTIDLEFVTGETYSLRSVGAKKIQVVEYTNAAKTETQTKTTKKDVATLFGTIWDELLKDSDSLSGPCTIRLNVTGVPTNVTFKEASLVD